MVEALVQQLGWRVVVVQRDLLKKRDLTSEARGRKGRGARGAGAWSYLDGSE
jgi:hypothetical protein